MNIVVDYERRVLMDVLIEHQRVDAGHCSCGWGMYSQHWGRSHAQHVVSMYERARGL